MINLISNALKFTNKITGEIELRISSFQENLIRISVKDNGLGMS